MDVMGEAIKSRCVNTARTGRETKQTEYQAHDTFLPHIRHHSLPIVTRSHSPQDICSDNFYGSLLIYM